MNEPQREIFAKNLEEASQEELQDVRPLDSIDNFTCHVAPGSTQVTWTSQHDSFGRLVNVVCWDTSNYNVNATAINLSRIEWVNNVRTVSTPLFKVYGENPPYVDRIGINQSHWYQYSLMIDPVNRPVTRTSGISQPHPITHEVHGQSIDPAATHLGELFPVFNTEEELTAHLERFADTAERATPNAGEHINELPPAQLKNSHLENPEG